MSAPTPLPSTPIVPPAAALARLKAEGRDQAVAFQTPYHWAAAYGAVAVTLLFVAVSVLAGYVLGGPSVKTKRVLALGTGQRNLSAAFIIATGNFGDKPDVLVFVAAAGLLGLVLLFPTAGGWVIDRSSSRR